MAYEPLSPEQRAALLEDRVAIDPVTNMGTSAAREIIAFTLGLEASHLEQHVAFFKENPVNLSRFGICQADLEVVDTYLAEA